MPIIVFDLESSGLPVFASNRQPIDPRYYKYYNSSRVIELGYAMYEKKDGNWKSIKEVSILVRPEGFVIENTDIHGITHDDATKHGHAISKVLEMFQEDLMKVNKVVAYNADFDYNVILAEAYRCKNKEFITELKSKKIICAMKLAKEKLNLRHIKLIDLYNRLFTTFDIQEHRALADVQMTAKCLFKLSK